MYSIEGLTVNKDGLTRSRIEIDENTGLITKVSEPIGSANTVLEDELIFPGFIDLHVHAREDASYGQNYKEDFVSAGEAAINGGIVAFADMPNNLIPPIDDQSYNEKKEITKKCAVDVLLYAGIGPKTHPLIDTVPYKIFMGQSVGDLFFTNNQDIEEAVHRYHGQNISFHCEDPEILDAHVKASTHDKKRPPQAEISAVEFALDLIEKYNITGRICHTSVVASIHKIAEAKKRGVKVTAEITPHHLYFSKEIPPEDSKVLQVNPPLRSEAGEVSELIGLLKSGKVDYLATDHAPHTVEEKSIGISGLPHLDTYGAFVTWLMAEHGFTPADVLRVCSENPATFYNKFSKDKYGEIKVGYVGSLTVLDINNPTTITKDMLKTKCKWSPFEGVTFPGRAVVTVVRGKEYKN